MIDYKDTKQETMGSTHKATRWVIYLMMVSFVIRCTVASLVELGNDEVYYWSYAAHPALAYYDHPGMIGWLIRLCTVNLAFHAEFFVRLPALLLGTLNIWLMYVLTKHVSTPRAGVMASILYAASGYGALVSGTLVLPDTPLTTFWILSLHMGVRLTEASPPRRADAMTMRTALVGLGIAIGLACLSKYQGVMLGVGVLAYLAVRQRHVFRSPWLYAALAISVIVNLPTIAWHASNDFVSFTHAGGVSVQGRSLSISDLSIRPLGLFEGLGGQLAYANPVVWVITVSALWQLIRSRITLTEPLRILLWMSIPIIIVFTTLALFRTTLPHWALPGYIGLFVVAAVCVDQREVLMKWFLPVRFSIALGLLVVVLPLAIGVIHQGWLLPTPSPYPPEECGRTDVTLDMYGWEQLGNAFMHVRDQEVGKGAQPHLPIVATRWFDLAHLEYYVATPHNLNVVGLGNMGSINNYAWVDRTSLPIGGDAWFLTTSRTFTSPSDLLQWFETVMTVDTVPILRNGRVAGYGFISLAHNYRPK